MKSLYTILLCSAATLFSADGPGPVTVTKDTVFSFYGDFKRLTKQPLVVAPLTAARCSLPSPELVEKEKQATGPHYKVRIHLYANILAQDTMARKLGIFAEGSTIIKEKLASDNSVTGVGGMIKRSAGYDPKNGDWEYFYSDKGADFSTGHLQSCAECHNGAATDHVFSARKSFE